MADITVNRVDLFSNDPKKIVVVKYRDMGDGTFAPIMVNQADINSGVIGNTPFSAVVGPFSDTTSHAVKAAGGAGIKNKLASYTVSNTSATASAFSFLDGSTVLWTGQVAANSEKSFTFPVPLVGTANTALNFQLATTSTATTVSVTGYQGA